jgi:hypothetical protein
MTDVSPETMARELLPCPHCDRHERGVLEDGIGWLIECPNCGARTGTFPTKPMAITAWNRRAGYSAALAAPLTEEERGEIAYALCKEDADRIEAAHCRQYCELAERSFKKRCPYLGAVNAAFARLVQLRTQGEKK